MADEIDDQTLTKTNNKAIWIKGLYILVFFVAGYIAIFVTFFVVIFQFLAECILKKPNEHLSYFGDTLGIYVCAVVRYLTGATDEMPFPFKSWPKSSHGIN